MSTPVHNDADLMRRLATRDQAALSQLYQQYGRAVFSLAYQVLQNHTFAEEVTQDTFLTVWNTPEQYDPARGTLLGWMLAITRNRAIDRLRKEQRRPLRTAVDLDEVSEFIGGDSPLDDPAWHDGQLLRALLLKLPPEQRQVIELGFFKGMTHTEMADQLQLPVGTVKTRVRLGLQKLKESWTAAQPPPDRQR